MQPPAPKYWLGESIGFNRARYTDIASPAEMGGATMIGKIHMAEVRISSESSKLDSGERSWQWTVIYWTEHDDGVPEDCVLGIPTMSTPR